MHVLISLGKVGMMAENEAFIIEGKAKIKKGKEVFYNKVQEFNRDLSVLAVHSYLKNELWKSAKKTYVKERVSILDALSASGLRSIRYSLECKQCSLPVEIIANDISEKAIETIESNIDLNGTYNVIVTNEDASMLMHKKKSLNERITIIDLDPYGSPTPFLDAAIQNIVDGGLLMVTSTDMAVLCGNHGGACFAKYGSFPIRAKFCHEMALRIVIASVASHASRYGRYVFTLLGSRLKNASGKVYENDHFSKTYVSPKSDLAHVVICKGCESFHLQPLCNVKSQGHLIPANVVCDRKCSLCDHPLQIGGPIWSGPIHQSEFINLLQNELKNFESNHFGTTRRMEGMLQLVSEELTDCPLYYQLDRLCSLANCPMPSFKIFRSILINGGYKFSLSHALKNSIKTNAPVEFIWAIVKHFHQKSESKIKDDSPIAKVLNKNFEYTLNDKLIDEEPKSKFLHLLRYQVNPEENWGPKSKPNAIDKSSKNQNKKRLMNNESELNEHKIKRI